MSLEDYPDDDQIEVSIFGGGNSYGESILIHATNHFWVIIDSTINPDSQSPLALEYLSSISANYKSLIKIAVATHWHDDHIRGLSQIISNSQNCNFLVVSEALNTDNFLALTEHDDLIKSFNSGIKEFRSILSHISKPGNALRLRKAISDRPHFDDIVKSISIRISTLSPSDIEVDKAIKFFAEQLIELTNDPNFVLKKQNENDHSVVTLITIDDTTLLFGADLEFTGRTDSGWQNILDSLVISIPKSIIYKVPHHGSSTSHNDAIWENLLHTNVYALITPWKKGAGRLPLLTDATNILSKTNNAFITSKFGDVKVKKRDKKVYKITNELDINITEIPYTYGHIRLRKKLNESNWNVELFGNALHLKDLY